MFVEITSTNVNDSESIDQCQYVKNLRIDFTKEERIEIDRSREEKHCWVRCLDTICTIHAMASQIVDGKAVMKPIKVLGKGSSLQNPLDQYNKYTGKKLALQRALVEEERTRRRHKKNGKQYVANGEDPSDPYPIINMVFKELPKPVRKQIWIQFFDMLQDFTNVPVGIRGIKIGRERRTFCDRCKKDVVRCECDKDVEKVDISESLDTGGNFDFVSNSEEGEPGQ